MYYGANLVSLNPFHACFSNRPHRFLHDSYHGNPFIVAMGYVANLVSLNPFKACFSNRPHRFLQDFYQGNPFITQWTTWLAQTV
jgi:hypothetical protein